MSVPAFGHLLLSPLLAAHLKSFPCRSFPIRTRPSNLPSLSRWSPLLPLFAFRSCPQNTPAVYLLNTEEDVTCAVVNNCIADNGGTALQVGETSRARTVVVAGNTITNNQGFGIFVERGAGGALRLERNVVCDNARGDVKDDRQQEPEEGLCE